MLTPAAPEVWERSEAIDRLRAGLRALTDDEHSMCQVAAEKKIFCHGFRRWNGWEFERRWKSAIGRCGHLSRAQMEEFADLWQLAEQLRKRVGLACDANAGSGHGPCRGWDEFSNSELSRFCADVLGKNVDVVQENRSEIPAARPPIQSSR